MIEDIIEKLRPSIEANNFFFVPNGETIGYFLIDGNGKSIDCNIYHPKYGKKYEPTFFRSVHYADPQSGKKITCLYYKEILCEHEDGTYSNKDGIQVFEKEARFRNTKVAETQGDFDFIYERERTKSGVKDESFFHKHLIELVCQKENEYKSKIGYKDWDATTLELFYQFKKWLSHKKIAEKLNKNCDQNIMGNDNSISKCKRYPNCDCFIDWEQPALNIDKNNAELFVTVMKEVQTHINTCEWIEFQMLQDKIKSKCGIIPQSLHGLFLSKVLWLIEQYLWKMPEKSDLIRLNKLFRSEISSNNEIDYFTNEKNIPNQKLVRETIEYFEKGHGLRVFNALEILNLLEKQYHFVLQNIDKTSSVVESLKSLPLSDLEKHVLYGLILKWFGGYPVNNLDEDCDRTLKEIEKEFLRYEDNTPEKEFCKADFEQRKLFMKMGIAMTASINHGVPIHELLNATEPSQTKSRAYSSFEDLFADAVSNNAIGKIGNKQTYLIERSRYNYEFNVWLQEFKAWRYGDEQQYAQFLNKESFIEYLKYQKQVELNRQAEKENEKATWRIDLDTSSNQISPINKKPIFNQTATSVVFEILKGFFKLDEHDKLKVLLEYGNNAGQSLIFLGNGNRLADTFKKLFEHGFITGCSKQELENWIGNNFKFQPADQIKSFTKDYLQKCISRKNWVCKEPLIEISNREIQMAVPFRKKGR